jgi:hypothetical protein
LVGPRLARSSRFQPSRLGIPAIPATHGRAVGSVADGDGGMEAPAAVWPCEACKRAGALAYVDWTEACQAAGEGESHHSSSVAFGMRERALAGEAGQQQAAAIVAHRSENRPEDTGGSRHFFARRLP